MSRILLILALTCLWLNFCPFSHAQAILTDKQGIRCIIGEAGNQGFDGLVAVADALQNRGHTGGVYGCNAKHIDREPKWVWDMARKAWESAKVVDVVFQADHWHNVVREGETYWTVKMTKTVCIKDHCFYKE